MYYKKSFLFFSVIILFLAINLINAEEDTDEGYSGKLTVTNTGGGRIIITGPGQMPTHYCGNDVLETYIGEQCDGSVGPNTCASLGFDSGDLSCQEDCVFDTSNCANDPVIPVIPVNPGNPGPGGSSPSGGSIAPATCVEAWTCASWGECEDESQSRTCNDVNKCGTKSIKPIDARGCSVEGESGDEALETISSDIPQNNQEGFFSKITGAVVGGGTGKTIGIIIFIVAIMGISIFTYKKRNKKRNKSK